MGYAQTKYQEALARIAAGEKIFSHDLSLLAANADREREREQAQAARSAERRETAAQERQEREERARAVEEQSDTLGRQIRQHLRVLKAVAADKATDSDQAIGSVLFATSLLQPEDAALIGPQFKAARDWIMDADDAEGAFEDAALEDDASGYPSDLLHREAVAGKVAGHELLALATREWEEARTGELMLSRGDWEHVSDTGAEDLFVRLDEAAHTLEFANSSGRLFSLKLGASEVEDVDMGSVTQHRASNWLAVDQTWNFALVGEKLYRREGGQGSLVARLQLPRVEGLSSNAARVHSDYRVPQQLVTLNDQPIWVGGIDLGDGTKVIASVDIVKGKLLWQLPSEREFAPGSWYFSESGGRWYHLVQNMVEVQAPKKEIGLWDRLTGSTLETRKDYQYEVVERDALTGRELRRARLDRLATELAGAEEGTILALEGQETVAAQIDMKSLACTPADGPLRTGEPALPADPVGPTRLSFLIDYLSHHPGKVTSNGEVSSTGPWLVERQGRTAA